MKYASTKTWPWPVLRHGSSDYEKCELQAEIEVALDENSTATRIFAEFDLSDDAILALISESKAQYAVLVNCTTTLFRHLFLSSNSDWEWEIEEGYLAERIDITPFVLTTSRIESFRSKNWHEDYGDREFTLEPGAVLAIESPSSIWIQPKDEVNLSTVFRAVPDPNQEKGEWRCDLYEDYVQIHLHPDDNDQFSVARSEAESKNTTFYIMNGIYFPALLWVISEVDKDVDAFSDFRWFGALNEALLRNDCSELGSEGNINRLQDAQKILKSPFSKSPFMMEDGEF